MKHPEQNDAVTNHIKEGFGERDKALNDAVQKFMERNGPSEYTCSLCLSVFKDVNDTAHLKQHINSKHTKILKGLDNSLGESTASTNFSLAVGNDIDEEDQEENMQDSDEDYVPNSSVSSSAKRIAKRLKTQRNINKPQRFEEGMEQAEAGTWQTRQAQWGFKKKSSSIIWNIMIKLAPKETMCQLCSKRFNFDGSTSNMHKHVKKVHPTELALVMSGGTLELPPIDVAPAAVETKREIIATESAQLDQIVDEVLNHEETSAVTSQEKGPYFKKRPTSIIWHFMARIGLNKTMCRLCKRRFNYAKGSTSNMHKHIKCSHAAALAKVLAGEGPLVLPSHTFSSSLKIMKRKAFISNKNMGGIKFLPGGGAQQLDYLVNMAVSSMIPCSMVENEGFAKFVRMLNPKFQVPDKELMGQAIAKLHKKHCDLLQQQLDKAPGISISTEIWTHRERQQYLTVTAHFVSDTWDVQSAVLKTVLLDSSSLFSSSVAARLEQVISEYNIMDKVKCIVIDNTDYLNAAVIALNKPHFYCLALALNTTVQESLKASTDIGYLSTRVRDIANVFLFSDQASEKLKQLQLSEGKAPLQLLQDCEWDWISTYKMFKRYSVLHTHLAPALSTVNGENVPLVVEEIELLTHCVQVLEPFALAAEDMASDGFTTLSKSLPVFEILKQMISNRTEVSQSTAVMEYCPAAAFTRDLNERVEKCMSIIGDRTNFLPWAATLLDPRFKHMVVEDLEMQQWVVTQLQQMMGPSDLTVENEQAVPKPGEDVDANINLLWSAFDETIKRSVLEEPVDELQRYIEERPITRQENPFKWWMEREHLYPKLCNVVKQFLSIPATSIPSGQLFLEAERRNLSLRNFIEDSQLDSFLFLSSCQIVT